MPRRDGNPEENNESWDGPVAYPYWEAETNPTNYFWSGVTHTYELDDGNTTDETGYYNHMDEALILEGIDLSGADAAFGHGCNMHRWLLRTILERTI